MAAHTSPMNGTQVMSNHHYSQRGQPQSSHYAESNSPAHYNGQPQQAPPPTYDQRGYSSNDRSRRGRDEEEHHRRRSRSNHRNRTSSNRDQYPDQTNQFHYPGGGQNNVTPPSQDAASSSNLAQSSTLDATQRRPAYLLHRDLVIGKGSYGQVCIASRGEAEGHHSNKSGKRKKFACKCVMLRNDPKYIAKLQEEVNVLRELRGHDNVIRLFDVFCVDNELFIITELGRGGDLFHLLTTHPKHGVTEAYAGESMNVVNDANLVPKLWSCCNMLFHSVRGLSHISHSPSMIRTIHSQNCRRDALGCLLPSH